MFSRLVLIMLFFTTRSFSLPGTSEQAVVRAVLFYSPTCGHCHVVIEETLPSLMAHYGEQLEIIGVDVTQPPGQAFFTSAIEMFALESAGVPFLVVGNEYLIGSADIPDKFPILIEQYLAAGGVDWPDIPGLREAISTSQTAQPPTPKTAPATTALTEAPTIGAGAETGASVQPAGETFTLPTQIGAWQRVMLDPIGNGLAIVVLLSMLVTLIKIAVSFRNPSTPASPSSTQILIPALCLIGLGVAGYLTYVETTQALAVCGPLGDCNTVQQSEYARLFGVLPIGALGLVGYVFILLSWLAGRTLREPMATFGKLTTFALCTFGIMFSMYLTFLEPFVIGATCAWCLTSAILMSSLSLLALPDGKLAISNLKMKRFSAAHP